MKQRLPSPRLKVRILQAVLSLALLLLLFAAGIAYDRHLQAQNTPVITSDLISERLHTISELATVEYHYTNMGQFKNQVDFYGWNVPLTQKSFILSYDGVIKAGIDASQISVALQEQTILISLPQSKILSHEMDEDSLVIFDETNSVFNPLTIRDYTDFAAAQKAEIEARAIKNGLLTEAQTRAQTTVRQLLSFASDTMGYTIQIT